MRKTIIIFNWELKRIITNWRKALTVFLIPAVLMIVVLNLFLHLYCKEYILILLSQSLLLDYLLSMLYLFGFVASCVYANSLLPEPLMNNDISWTSNLTVSDVSWK